MTDTAGPFDTVSWAEAEWYTGMGSAMLSGVVGTPAATAGAGPLGWSNSGLSVTLQAGVANVAGSTYKRVAPLTAVSVTPNANSTLSRRDRLVLRRDLGTHTVTPVVITGTPSASPAAPDIVRSSTQFDLPLFTFLVPPASGTNITGVVDQRVYINEDQPNRLSVYAMANRPTAGLYPGMELIDSTVGRAWRYDGTYWRDSLSGNFTPAGATAGDYITGLFGSAAGNVGPSGVAAIALPRSYDAAPFAIVSPGSIASNIGMVAYLDTSSDGSTLRVVCRKYDGGFVANGDPVRINYHCIGYND